MTGDFLGYARALGDIDDGGPLPVGRWSPTRRIDIGMAIAADGTWFHDGVPILKPRLVRLFSRILRRDGDEYFLVTPAEKCVVRVADAPFIAVSMAVGWASPDEIDPALDGQGPAGNRVLSFSTNVGDQVAAGPGHEIVMTNRPDGSGKAPYIHVRDGLSARLGRNIYYDLVDLAEGGTIDGDAVFAVRSGGMLHRLDA
ncbi:MAG: DUF1285 domain-containing protein [Pseudomonadota bacterium]